MKHQTDRKHGSLIQQRQFALEIHKPIRHKFPRRKVMVSGIDSIWASDLVEMPPERGFKYILTIVDVFSKFAWAIPLKSKTGIEMTETFEKILQESDRVPKKIWSDKGKEYYNKIFLKFLKDRGIELYSVESEIKCSVAERFNRTLKEMMYRKFTELESNSDSGRSPKWVKLLPELVHEYNHRVHSTIKMTPIEGSKKKNEEQIQRDVFSISPSVKKPKYKIGDFVRIYKYKNLFEKGYIGRWTKEVFEISKILPTNPVSYITMDEDDEEIKGGFYEQELLKSEFGFEKN